MEKAEDIFECAPFFNITTNQNYGTHQMEVPLKRNTSITVSSEMSGVTLHWGNINVSSVTNNKTCPLFNIRRFKTTPPTKQIILDNVSGLAYPGSLLAIIGPNAFSNTTLLKALALKLSPSLIVSGKVALNGHVLERKHLQQMAGFVGAENSFYSTITVREHLWFTAKLKLDSRFTNEQIQQRINGIVNQTGLRFRDKERIGDLSCGDLKLLAIATEMVGDPPLLFCDEPTFEMSDQQVAQKIVGILETMSAKGKTILCAIRQPTSYIFGMFTDVCLLTAHGQVAFLGPIRDASMFFESLGYQCPPFSNPANFYLQSVTLNTDENLRLICDKFSSSRHSMRLSNSIASSLIRQKDISLESYIKYHATRFKTTWLTQFRLLLKRSFINTIRQRQTALYRICQKLFIITIISLFYTKSNSITPQNFMGIVLLLLIGNFQPTLHTAIQTTPQEIPCLIQENQDNLYRIEAFYMANFLVTLPECVIESILTVTIVLFITGVNNCISTCAVTVSVIFLLTNIAKTLGFLLATFENNLLKLTNILYSIDYFLLTLGGLFCNVSQINPIIKWTQYLFWFRYANDALQVIQWKPILTEYVSNGTDIDSYNNTALIPDNFFNTENINEEMLVINLAALSLLCLTMHIVNCLALLIKAKRTQNKLPKIK